jgi:hypothetical protein
MQGNGSTSGIPEIFDVDLPAPASTPLAGEHCPPLQGPAPDNQQLPPTRQGNLEDEVEPLAPQSRRLAQRLIPQKDLLVSAASSTNDKAEICRPAKRKRGDAFSSYTDSASLEALSDPDSDFSDSESEPEDSHEVARISGHKVIQVCHGDSLPTSFMI